MITENNSELAETLFLYGSWWSWEATPGRIEQNVLLFDCGDANDVESDGSGPAHSRFAPCACCCSAGLSGWHGLGGNGVGGWSALEVWPLIPIHAALTPDGRVLTYGATAAGAQTGSFIYDVWDPAQGLAAGHLTLPNGTSTDIFCNVQIIVPGANQILWPAATSGQGQVRGT